MFVFTLLPGDIRGFILHFMNIPLISSNMKCPPNKGLKMNRCSAKPGLVKGIAYQGERYSLTKTYGKLAGCM